MVVPHILGRKIHIVEHAWLTTWKSNSNPTSHSIQIKSAERVKLNCYEAANKTTIFLKKKSTPRPITTDPICHNKLEIPYLAPNHQAQVQLTCAKLHLNHNFTHHHPHLNESNCKFKHPPSNPPRASDPIPEITAHRHQEHWKISRLIFLLV